LHSIYISFTEFTTVKYDWEQALLPCVAIPTSKAISSFYFRGGSGRADGRRKRRKSVDTIKKTKKKIKETKKKREHKRGRSLD